jgi:L-malate glycosyltransferase
MRVAHCIHGLGLGGAQEVIRQIVAGRQGDFTYHVYSCEGGALSARVAAAGATVRLLPRRWPKLDPLWVARLARAMRADAIDLVHTHLFGDSLHGYLAARAAGALPVVMTLHSEPALSTPLQRAGYRWLAARADQLVACGDSVARSSAVWRTARPPCTVVNGIADPATPATPPPAAHEVARLRAALGVPPQALVFATVGRLVPVKGYGHLLAALAAALPALPEPVRLVMIGDGPDAPALRAQAAATGLGERVVFAGTRDDVTGLLAAADVVVFSSTCEGLPMALLEAMAAARCIVASALPGIVEAVRPGREAVTVPPADRGALAAALRRVAADPDLRARLGSAARVRFLAAYTAPRMVASYETIYRDTWSRARRGAPRAEAPAA